MVDPKGTVSAVTKQVTFSSIRPEAHGSRRERLVVEIYCVECLQVAHSIIVPLKVNVYIHPEYRKHIRPRRLDEKRCLLTVDETGLEGLSAEP